MASVPATLQHHDCEMLSDDPPVKRLTMVEKARLEALSAFGNEDFNSMSVKRDDFRSKLNSTATKSANNSRRVFTRLDRAKVEANAAFKNIELGHKTPNMKKRKFQESNGENQDHQKTNLTRLQKAKAEVDIVFQNVSLAAIPPKKSKIEKEKIEAYSAKKDKKKIAVKVPQKVEWNSPCQPCLQPSLSNLNEGVSQKRFTRSESAKLKGKGTRRFDTPDSYKKVVILGTNAFENVGSDPQVKVVTDIKLSPNILNSKTCKVNVEPNSQGKESDKKTPNLPKRLTKLEKAKLEALQSFSGHPLDEICKQSSRIVAKHLKPKRHSALNTEKGIQSKTPVQVPPLKKEAQKTNKSDIDVYSSITEGNFKNQISILETSRRVVETAVSLETPEGSPMSNIQ